MKNYLSSGIIAVSMLLAVDASAQTPVQWTRTLQFEGVWTGVAELNLGGQLFYVNYTTDFRQVIDGNGMTMDEGFSDPNLGELKGANLIGYSPYDDQIHWFSVDNFGTAHEHTGSWINPKRFYMEHHSIQNGLPFAEYIDFRLRANNTRMAVSLVATLGPDTIQTIEGTLYLQGNNNRLLENSPEKTVTQFAYPNPSTGEIFVESESEIEQIRVVNETGQIVYEAFPSSMEHMLRLQQSGVYFVQIQSGGSLFSEKIVINAK